MALGGLWHGAAWTFVVWGALHGLALIVNHLWRSLGFKMHWLLGRILTFFFLTTTWVIFKAENLQQAYAVLKGMINVKHIGLHIGITQALPAGRKEILVLLLLYLFVSFWKNSNEWVYNFKPNWKWALAVTLFLVAGIYGMNRVSEFLYFQF